MNIEAIIDVVGLTKYFAEKKVVDEVNLRVTKGEVFGFLGPNGSGKTTTIRMLCGLLTPDAGSGHCLGYDILSQSKLIKQHVGYMTQQFSFYTDLTVDENLNFIGRVFGVANRKARVAQIIDELNLNKYQHHLTGDLSGGWKQRVALAACLLHNPQLLLLDEPTAGVDPVARREFWDKIHALSEQGVTILISTHYMDEAERCTRLAYLTEGHLMLTGTVKDVIAMTRLSTWEIDGDVTTHLLVEVKRIPGIIQAAMFGNRLHVNGYDKVNIETGLTRLAQEYRFQWQAVAPTMEDAFISLVEQSKKERA